MNSMLTPQDVLDFWFGAPGSSGHGQPRDVWFRKSDAFDQAVRERFLGLYELAAGGGLAAWGETPRALLALIIVCDQFPRNMFRNDPRAFATDAQALAAAERMVNSAGTCNSRRSSASSPICPSSTRKTLRGNGAG